MFKVDPNTIYTVNELAEISGYCVGSIYNLIKKGLPAVNGPGGKMITGRAILKYFDGEQQEPKENKRINIKLEKKLQAAGIKKIDSPPIKK